MKKRLERGRPVFGGEKTGFAGGEGGEEVTARGGGEIYISLTFRWGRTAKPLTSRRVTGKLCRHLLGQQCPPAARVANPAKFGLAPGSGWPGQRCHRDVGGRPVGEISSVFCSPHAKSKPGLFLWRSIAPENGQSPPSPPTHTEPSHGPEMVNRTTIIGKANKFDEGGNAALVGAGRGERGISLTHLPSSSSSKSSGLQIRHPAGPLPIAYLSDAPFLLESKVVWLPLIRLFCSLCGEGVALCVWCCCCLASVHTALPPRSSGGGLYGTRPLFVLTTSLRGRLG